MAQNSISKDEIISMVRSCLISTKGRICLRQLDDDFSTLTGQRIPFLRFGFTNLVSFIESIPTIILTRENGQIYLDAKPSQQSMHISNMVKKQKTVPIKKKYMNSNTNKSSGNTGGNKSKKNNRNRQDRRERLRAVSHRQFVKRSNNQNNNNNNINNNVKVPSKVLPTITYKPVQLNQIAENQSKTHVQPPVQQQKQQQSQNHQESVLTNAKKRIVRLMSEIDLERDSGNSSPTNDTPTTQQQSQEQQFIRTGDPVIDLKNFAQLYNLGDIEIKFTETKSKQSRLPFVFCKIKIGTTQSYSSYPNDFHDQKSSELFTAQKALDSLISKYSKRKSLLISSHDDIIERIPPMLEKHQNFIWQHQIESEYIDKYNELLPINWLQSIDVCPSVSIEKYLGGIVLKYCNPGDVLQKGKKMNINLNISDVSVPCNTIHFGDNNRLFATITSVTSAGEIWCQQYNTQEYNNFLQMVNLMETYFNKNKEKLLCGKINFGNCYCVYHANNWVRVRAISELKDGYVNCFMIDFGEECYVPITNIYYLPQEFAKNQAQAFVCRLDGLEEYYEVSYDSEHLQQLIGRKVLLELVLDENSDSDICIPVVMYDANDAHSITDELGCLLSIDAATPVLEKNTITEVYVSNIEDNGDVYVQIHSKGYENLMQLLYELEKQIETIPIKHDDKITKENSENCLYLIKYKITNHWLRCKIIDWSPKGDLVQIYFVDYGNTDIIKINNEKLYHLEKLDELLCQYPEQAIKVRIMLDKLPGDFLMRATKLMPKEHLVLLKIVQYDSEDVPWVEFFKRSSEGGLFCINKSIAVEAEVELQHADSTNLDKTNRKRLMSLVQYQENTKNVPSGGLLKKPPLPERGDYLNVNIPFAVNPWNFFIQPLDTLDKLIELMENMQQYYNNLQYSPLSIDDIIPGNIYASKYDDGRWYRTSVLKVIHSGSISVCYCDFGYYTNLTINQLLPLDEKFMSLPYQALKGKIAGIKPKNKKWTMEDCEIFKNLVTRKQFVSVLNHIEKDELYKSDIVLNLYLIDTTTSKDIHIRDELIKRDIADPIKND